MSNYFFTGPDGKEWCAIDKSKEGYVYLRKDGTGRAYKGLRDLHRDYPDFDFNSLKQ